MDNSTHNQVLTKIAKAGRWLFWLSLIYTAYLVLIMFVSSGVPMNPLARSSIWGRFRWHFPAVFDLIYFVVPLFFLYFSQSKLRKGVAQSDEKLIGEGLNYLFGLLAIKVILLIFNIILKDFIEPNWWGF